MKVKPRLTRGKGMWNPTSDCQSDDGVVCIRDKDVNCFLVESADGYIAIDSGYKNSPNVRRALSQFGIASADVKAVFLTHVDIDHAGGVDKHSNAVFPQADIYLGEQESKYLSGEYCRKKIAFHKCKLPIAIDKFATLADGQTVTINGVTVQAILTPGHTLGHTAYIINDKLIFSGDCIIAGDDGGYCFYDFWNTDTQLNKRSLEKLKRLCEQKNIEKIYTAHSGAISVSNAFRHCDKTPDWRKKGFVFSKAADYDPYE